MTTVPWTSPSGQTLAFEVQYRHADWNPYPGLYMFCRPDAGLWVPLYIGKALNLKDRLCAHERWDEAAKLGATNVHALVVRHEPDRDRWERELIQHFSPVLNVQLRLDSGSRGFGAYRPPAAAPGPISLLGLGLQLK